AKGHKETELVTGRAVAGGQLDLLAPARPAAHEHVGRPSARVEWRPDHGGAAAEGRGEAELVTGRAVAGGQLDLLAPARPAAHKHIGCPSVRVERRSRPDQRGVPAEAHGGAQLVTGQAVAVT